MTAMQPPADEPEARRALRRDLDSAIRKLNEARGVLASEHLGNAEFDRMMTLCGESRNVPITIAIGDLAEFHYGRR